MERKLFIFFFVLFICSCSKEETGDIEESDSVETVFNENTVVLNERQINAIVTVDGGVLSFENTIEGKDLPSIGQILFTSEKSKHLPYGFLGRVTQITEEAGRYKVETEPAPLDAVFDRLVIKESVDLVPATRVSVRKDEDGFFCMEQPITFEQNSASVTGTASLGFKLDIHIDINNRAHKPPYGYIILQSKVSGDLNFSLSTEKRLELRHPIGNEIPLSASLSNIVISPVLQLYGIVEGEGEISVDAGMTYAKKTIGAIEYKDGIWSGNARDWNSGDDNFGCKTTAGISLNGGFFAGIATAIELRLFNNENMKIAIEPKFGLNETGNFVIDLVDTDLFRKNKDSKIKAGLGIKIGAKVDAQIFGEGAEFPIWDKSFFERESYLFPAFENKNIKIDKDRKSVSADYSVGRDLLFGAAVGVALYKGNQVDSYSKPVNYFLNENFSNPLTCSFDNLQDDVEYTLCPYVMWGDSFYPGEPRHTFTLKNEESSGLVGRWIEVHSQGYYHSFSNPENNEEWDKDISADGIFCFKEDGTFMDTMYGTVAGGNWVLNGNQLIITTTWSNDSEYDPGYMGRSHVATIVELNESKLVLEFFHKDGYGEEYEKTTYVKVTSFLIGTWQRVSNSGWVKQGGYVDEWNNSSGEEGSRIVFNEDGTCKFYMYEDGVFVEDAFGTWDYKSGKICVWDSDAESFWTVKDLSASTLTMEMHEKETENNVVTYEFYEIDTYHKITNNLN
ncbi:lipocalin family protein [uncultured Coprobacter sp.]|uniref:lipocalin family protein n=1 Tax=uncultured Coprobacter sp. TaxID=1720550 RepID=UPI00261F1EA5|nr:lipocalin family protein [uncultured Coprobacter sp.]